MSAPTLRRGQVNIDWSNGRRTWVSDDGKTVCVHDLAPTEPIGYNAWHEWAPKYGRKHKQKPCATKGCPVLRWTTEASVVDAITDAFRNAPFGFNSDGETQEARA